MGVYVSTRQYPNGKKMKFYMISYFINGKRKRESIGKVGQVTKAQANAIFEERKRQIRLGQLDMIAAKIPTLKEFSKEYMNYVKNVRKKRSWDKDERSLRHMIEYFGNKKLNQISSREVEDYKEHMLNNGYKNASVNRELACLKHLFNLADRWNKFFGKNPVSRVEMLEENNIRMRVLTVEEERRFLEVSPPYLRSIVITALNTGMRKNEILSLKWEYVDFDKGIIILPHTNTKSKKTRQIPINANLRKVLLEQKLQGGGSEFVFHSDKSTTGHLNWLRHSFSTSCKRVGITDLTFHDFRDTFATRLIEAGVNIVAVSKILGHSDINLTIRRYVHLDDSLKKAVEVLERIG